VATARPEPGAGAAPASPRLLPFAFAKRHGVLVENGPQGPRAIYRKGTSPLSLAEARRFVGVPLSFTAVDAELFDARLQTAYESGAAMTMVEGLDDDVDLFAVAQQLPEPSDLLDSVDDAPIIRLINALLTQAVKNNASDIHIEPYENRLTVRFRIDGILQEVLQSRRAVAPLVVSRIKVMSKLDIAEKRLPQDGRISLRIAGRAVDVRVSTIPSGHGERVVLRLLDKQAGRLDLAVHLRESELHGLELREVLLPERRLEERVVTAIEIAERELHEPPLLHLLDLLFGNPQLHRVPEVLL